MASTGSDFSNKISDFSQVPPDYESEAFALESVLPITA